MAWQYNTTVHAWIYVQGRWDWGAVLGWHVEDLDVGNMEHPTMFTWNLSLWTWCTVSEWWDVQPIFSMHAEPNDVAMWMVRRPSSPVNYDEVQSMFSFNRALTWASQGGD